MKPQLDIQQNSAVISGEMTIRFAGSIQSLLNEVNDSVASSLSVKAPAAIDLSVVQLLWALRMERVKIGRSLEFSFELNEGDEKLLERCALRNIFDNNKSK